MASRDKTRKQIRNWQKRARYYGRRLWCAAPATVLCSEAGPDKACGVPRRACACGQEYGRVLWRPELRKAAAQFGEGVYVCPLCANSGYGCQYQTRRRPRAKLAAVLAKTSSRLWAAIDSFCNKKCAPAIVWGVGCSLSLLVFAAVVVAAVKVVILLCGISG